MDLGSELRQARESAGLSLSDLSARTRIPAKYFRAIEEHHFASIPSGIFVRSYIRTYAQEVGVNPSEAVAAYRAMTEPPPEVQPEAKKTPSTNEPAGDGRSSSRFDPRLLAPRSRWGSAFVAVVLLIGLIGINRFGSSSSAGSPPAVRSPIPQAPAPAARDAAPVVATSGAGLQTSTDTDPSTSVQTSTSVQASTSDQTSTGIQIEMRAEGLCWVRALADGQVVVARLLQPGETQSVTGQRDVVIRIGDPAALSYSINGKPGRPLGLPMVPVTAQFGPDGQLSIAS